MGDLERQLRVAVLKKDFDKAAAALRAGATPNSGHALLVLAAALGHAEMVELLIASGVNVNERDDGIGYTALHRAWYLGKSEVVALLLFSGADPNVRSKTGSRAFDIVPFTNIGPTERARLSFEENEVLGAVVDAGLFGKLTKPKKEGWL